MNKKLRGPILYVGNEHLIPYLRQDQFHIHSKRLSFLLSLHASPGARHITPQETFHCSIPDLIHHHHDTNRHRHQFPYALKALDDILAAQWDSPTFIPYRDAFPSEYTASPTSFRSHVYDLVSRDIKIAYLKNLQGYLWVRGYESGEIRCPLFPDVYPAFKQWHRTRIPIVIYSSGSVAAQKLLFQYTDCRPDEDLRGLISGYFDTVNAGMKMEKESYVKIAKTREEYIGKWLFLSDRVEEVEAAKSAGMQSFVVVRDGNVALSDEDKANHVLITSFDQIKVKGL